MKRAALVLAAAAALWTLPASPANATGRTLVVDRDGAQCPDAGFRSIQAAVAAANPGDTVHVCPDTYTETVTVDKRGLRLVARAGRLPRDCFDPSLAAPDPTRDAILSGVFQGFVLKADGVVLDGFVVQDTNTAVSTDQSFSGYLVRQILVQRNQFGARFGSSGDEPSRVTMNCFRSNGQGGAGGAVVSFPALGDTLRNGRIDHNDFYRNTFGIRLGAGSGSTIDHNRSLEDNVWLRPGGVHDLLVTQNHIGAGGSHALWLFPLGGVQGPNVNVVVAHNVIGGRGGSAVYAAADSLLDSVIAHNRLTGNALDGVALEWGNSGNRVEHNRADGNGSDGIHAGGATGNVFVGNRMFANREHDAHDDDRTANQWVNSACETDFPSGTICGVG